MTKILFVCLGNICRSTMAEFVMRDMVNKRGLGKQIVVASAGTSDEEDGNPVHHGTRRKLASAGVPVDPNKRARQMTKADYEHYDLLICMDSYNLRNMGRICPDTRGKYRMLLDYTGMSRDVADPWYTGDFEATWQDVSRGCAALLDTLKKEGKL